MEISKSESISTLAKALAQAQGAMPAVIMNATNPFFKTKYADLGAIIETSKPVLSKYDLSFSQIIFVENDRVGINTLLMHSSGEWIASSMSLPIVEGKNVAQAAGSLITYLRRYSLSAILGLYTEEDNDANDKKEKVNGKSPEEKTTEEKPTEKAELIDKVLKRLSELGGSKNEELVTLVKTFTPSANPNRIKDMDKLSELYQKLVEFKNDQEKK